MRIIDWSSDVCSSDLNDGFQNPGLKKDLSLLVIDACYGLGNGRVMPAGPLRETPASGFARADAVVLIGDGPNAAVAEHLPPGLPVLQLGRASCRARVCQSV